MTTIGGKIFELFRNLKGDAVPKAPRPENQTPDDDVTDAHAQQDHEYVEQDEEEIVINLENFRGNVKPKKKVYTNKTKDDPPKADKKKKEHTGTNNVHTQAAGNVINIVGSKNLHFGNEFTYYLGPTTTTSNQQQNHTDDSENMKITKCKLITLLLEAKIRPDYEYMEYISKNLGKNWYSFFRFLGYSQGRIETYEIDEARNGGVSEARYKLLLDWSRNDPDGTLGCLSTKLWEHGERQIVKELALIYNNNHKKL